MMKRKLLSFLLTIVMTLGLCLSFSHISYSSTKISLESVGGPLADIAGIQFTIITPAEASLSGFSSALPSSWLAMPSGKTYSAFDNGGTASLPLGMIGSFDSDVTLGDWVIAGQNGVALREGVDYQICQTGSNYAICSKALQNETPVAVFNFSPDNGTAPLAVHFTDSSTGTIDSWSWNFGDGESSTEQNPSHIYQNSGDYHITLSISGPGGSDTTTGTITVSKEKPQKTGMAAPEKQLDALAYVTDEPLAYPADILIILVPGPIFLQPKLTVVPADVGQPATMLLYVWLPDFNVGFTLGQRTVTLSDTLDFAQLLPQALDLSDYDGLVIDIYYCYILNDGTIKYNDYEVRLRAEK